MIGWPMVAPRPVRRWLLLWVCLTAALAQAAPEPPLRSEEVDADFLDFLGSWENETDRWVDPFRIGEDLLPTSDPEAKRGKPGVEAGAGKPLKGIEPNQPPEKPREPMRTQTGP